MTPKQLGLIGAGLVAVSLVLPSVSVPIVGSMSYYRTDYMLLALLTSAAIGIFGAMRSSKNMLWAAGIIGAIANAVFIVRFNQVVAEMRNGADSGGLSSLFAEALSNNIQLQFGVFVSIAGAIVLIISAIQTAKLSTSELPTN